MGYDRSQPLAYRHDHFMITPDRALIKQPPLTHVSRFVRVESLKAFYRLTMFGACFPGYPRGQYHRVFSRDFVLRWLQGIGSVNRGNVRRLYLHHWKEAGEFPEEFQRTIDILKKVGGRVKIMKGYYGRLIRFRSGIDEEEWAKEQRWPIPYLPKPRPAPPKPVETKEPGPFVCVMCLRGFHSGNKMHKHIRAEHPEDKDGLRIMGNRDPVPAGHKWEGLAAIWKRFEA